MDAVTLCNLALGHLAIGKSITSLTERSAEALACARFYAPTRDEVLRDFPWPCATAFATLALVAAQPTTEWGYSYRVPADCLFVRRVLSGRRVDTADTRVPFRLATDANGRLLYCDVPDAQIEYTIQLTDPAQYDPDVVQAMALKLAAYLAPQLTGGDPNRLGARATQLYLFQLARAQATAANEAQDDPPVDPSFIQARA